MANIQGEQGLLSSKIATCDITLSPVDNKRLMNLCGRFDEHIRLIETRLKVEILNRGHEFQILGEHSSVKLAHLALTRLYTLTETDPGLTPEKVHLLIKEIQSKVQADSSRSPNESHVLRTRFGNVRPLSKNQQLYVQSILSHDINFGVGPAGTGKTFLAVACAVQALETQKVRRILLVRPAVEAGERLGFLPGDLAQKIDPYLRPLYDALYEMLGFEKVTKFIEQNIIEVAPLAYMRGRTLNEAFIILDESQNTTCEQMKMFLTRIGFGSTVVVNGDITQIDLPNRAPSGLKHVTQFLQGTPGISFTFFNDKDVVRHPLVQKIIRAYEAFEQKGSNDKND